MCFLYKMTIALKTKAETEKISAIVFENSRQNKEIFSRKTSMTLFRHSDFSISLAFLPRPWYNETTIRFSEDFMTEVVAALIWNGGKFMICRRPPHKSRGLLWEFVGGKVEKGETKEQALVRECKEELAIDINIKDDFCRVTHVYPDITIALTLFNAEIAEGTPKLLEHVDLKWITPSEIPLCDFCPADKEILEKIAKDGKS